MIYPMFIMILLIVSYACFMAFGRVGSAKRGEINRRYFKTMSGYEVPDKIQVATRHFNNLLETPPLFLIAGALIIALGLESTLVVIVSWLYVISRLAHTYIHNTYNHPLHRMGTFAFGLICILILWIVLLVRL